MLVLYIIIPSINYSAMCTIKAIRFYLTLILHQDMSYTILTKTLIPVVNSMCVQETMNIKSVYQHSFKIIYGK